MNWIKVSDRLPPDEELHVMDEFGNTGYAQPCWYSFNLVNGKVVHVDPYWDGSWLVRVVKGLTETGIEGNITHWMPLRETETPGD